MTDAKVDPILAEDEEDLALERQAFEQEQARQRTLASEREQAEMEAWQRAKKEVYYWPSIVNLCLFVPQRHFPLARSFLLILAETNGNRGRVPKIPNLCQGRSHYAETWP